MQLESKTGFITGGTSGIGLATAKAFIRRGARVAVTGRDRDRVDTAVFLLGPSSIGFVADAGNDQAMKRAIEQTAQPSGGIDILFANAGHYFHSTIGHTRRAALEDQFTVITNTFMTMQHALLFLRERASIVLMGSVYATMGPPGAGALRCKQGGNFRMARSLASELSPRASASMWWSLARSTAPAGGWRKWMSTSARNGSASSESVPLLTGW